MHWIIQRLTNFDRNQALIFDDQAVTYGQLHNLACNWASVFIKEGLPSGAVVSLEGNWSPNSCALILALIHNHNIVVPICGVPESKLNDFLTIAEVEYRLTNATADEWQLAPRLQVATHEFYKKLQQANHAGLVLFSSGTTGSPKASVMNFDALLNKHVELKLARRTMAFLSLDHIGGINTLMHTVSQGGALITLSERNADTVCAAIEQWHVQVLPTTPTFLNMLLISGALEKYNTSSLSMITYGTEPMPAVTLDRLHKTIPRVKLKQTYGLSELGILPTQSRGSSDLWIKLGSTGFTHKIINNILWIKSDTAMLGYLNAASPFDDEGFFNTQDWVEADGEYIKILGRSSEIINVGGEKVYPGEVENVILAAGNIADVTVMGHPNPVMGMVVQALIQPIENEAIDELKQRVRTHCRAHLEQFKIPMLIDVAESKQYSSRFKKMRNTLRETVNA